MNLLSHRGYWTDAQEKNTFQALQRSRICNFGAETDIRDHNGELFISHDMAVNPLLSLRRVLEDMELATTPLTLALNIKADGLSKKLAELLSVAAIQTRYFAFDMSVPEMLHYLAQGIPTYTRCSDIEKEPLLLSQCQGVWLDSFGDDKWITPNIILKYLEQNKEVCLVSSELHNRDERRLWDAIKACDTLVTHKNFSLCTDKPEMARTFFNL